MSGLSVNSDDIRAAIAALGLASAPVCLHASLRSFGWVDGGARTVIDAYLSHGCTVLVPSFTGDFEVSPPDDRRYERNGCDYESQPWPGELRTDVYSPDSVEIEEGLGVLPRTVVGMLDRVRGDHPLNSFSAIGPLADALVEGQRPLHVYAPLEALASHGGSVVLMGVDLTSMTLLHLAEQRAGRTLFRRWARDPSGRVIECQLGSCSEGFERLRPALKPIERSAAVEQSQWRVYPAAETIALASEAICANPEITQCPNPRCVRCHDAILGGPVILDRS